MLYSQNRCQATFSKLTLYPRKVTTYMGITSRAHMGILWGVIQTGDYMGLERGLIEYSS